MTTPQQRIDALIARASTEEPTEEARTSAWIAVKMMRQHGGEIRLAGATPPRPEYVYKAPAEWSPEPPRPRKADPSIVRNLWEPHLRCWSCKRLIWRGEEYVSVPGRAPLCGDCHAKGR